MVRPMPRPSAARGGGAINIASSLTPQLSDSPDTAPAVSAKNVSVEKGRPPTACLKCSAPLEAPTTGRPPRYCTVGCRRAAEFELRRLQRHLERLERQAESPWLSPSGLKETQDRIAQLEVRLRLLLAPEESS